MDLAPGQARARLERSLVATLGTADAAGHPHLVPVTYVLHGDHVYIAIDDKPKRSTNLKRLRNMAENPSVSLLVHEYADDWNRLWWVRADGTARVAGFDEMPVGLIDAFQRRYTHYAENPPAGSVIDITITKLSGWTSTDRP